MVFQMPRFIRRLIRRRMHPMAEKKAYDMKSRLAFIYAVIAWHAGAIVMYQIVVKGNKHWPTTLGITTKDEDEMRPAVFFAGILGVENAKVVRVSGTSIKVNDMSSVYSQPSENSLAQEEKKSETLPASV